MTMLAPVELSVKPAPVWLERGLYAVHGLQVDMFTGSVDST